MKKVKIKGFYNGIPAALADEVEKVTLAESALQLASEMALNSFKRTEREGEGYIFPNKEGGWTYQSGTACISFTEID